VRGDANFDDRIDISDPVFSLMFLFLGNIPPCEMPRTPMTREDRHHGCDPDAGPPLPRGDPLRLRIRLPAAIDR